MAAGGARGLLVVHRGGEWMNGTPWLAWSALAWRMGLWGLAGAALGALLALLPRPQLSRLGRPSHVRVARGFLLLPGLLLLWTAGEPWVGTLRAGARPSVIVLSLDTLRADRLPLMPRLEKILAGGVSFTQASSAAPWTLPSHASLFTSLLPFDHGAQWTHAPVRPRRLLLAELFKDAGYRTAAFTGGAYVGAEFGFGQGFEVYEDHDEEKEAGSAAIFSGARAWARRHRDAPFFLFVHTYEPHVPFRSGPEVTVPAGRLGPVWASPECDAVYSGRMQLSLEERRYVTALYDSDVRSTDRAVGGFLEGLLADGILHRAILVVVSDHGEDLWDHVESRSPGHGHSLYQELVHVPLAFRAPGIVAAGARLHTPVSLLDVAPTLLELCRLPPAPLHAGRTLAGALRRGVEPETRPVFAESIEFGPDRFAVREGPLKVIVTPHPERRHHDVNLDVRPVEVFDLSRDPGEREPNSGRHLDFLQKVNAMVDRGRQVLRPNAHDPPGSHSLSPAVEEQLRSLGYVQ
jgi:arylsulfatase A-like enzyme